jgi:hypothetical protein
MNKIKLEYEAPEVNTLEVKFEGCFCVSGPGSASNGLTDNDLGGLGEEDGE